jgi:hypothetical protein
MGERTEMRSPRQRGKQDDKTMKPAPVRAVCAQLNCETIFLEKWLTHLVFGFDGQ